MHTPAQDPPNRIIETVARFSSPDSASAFVQASAGKWRACAGKLVTETLKGLDFDWNFGPVEGTVPRIAQQHTRGDNVKTCHHVLHAQGADLIDVTVCGPNAAPGQASKIAAHRGEDGPITAPDMERPPSKVPGWTDRDARGPGSYREFASA